MRTQMVNNAVEAETGTALQHRRVSAWLPADINHEKANDHEIDFIMEKDRRSRSEPNLYKLPIEAEESKPSTSSPQPPQQDKENTKQSPKKVEDPSESKNKSSIITLSIRKNTRIIEKNKTVFNMLIRNEKLRNTLLLFYRNKIISLLTTLLWFFSTIVSICMCYNIHIIPKNIYVPYQIIYTLNFCILHSIFIRVDIVKELAKSFNFWFTMWNSVSFHVCSVALWGHSMEFICVALHSFSSILLLIFFDAHGGKRLGLMKLAVLNGFLSYIPIFFAFTSQITRLQNEKIYAPSTEIQLVDVRLQALDDLTTMVVYLLRILYNHMILKQSTTIAFVSHFYEFDILGKKGEKTGRYKITSSSEATNGSDLERPNKNDIEMHLDSIGPPHSVRSSDEFSLNQRRGSRSLQNLPEENQNHVIGHPDPTNCMIIGIMRDDDINYDLRKTFFHYFVKDKYPRLSKILRSRVYNTLGIVINVFSTIFSLPLSSGIKMNEALEYIGTVLIVFGTLYIIIQLILTCNIFMFHSMVRSFDYWFLMFLVFKAFISSGILCHWDSRMVSWFFIAVALTWFTMLDSFHVNYRKISYISILGIAWCLAISTLCKLNIGKTFEHDRFIEFNGIRFISAKITLTSSIISAAVFFVRLLWSYHRNHYRSFFITENSRVEHVVK